MPRTASAVYLALNRYLGMVCFLSRRVLRTSTQAPEQVVRRRPGQEQRAGVVDPLVVGRVSRQGRSRLVDLLHGPGQADPDARGARAVQVAEEQSVEPR